MTPALRSMSNDGVYGIRHSAWEVRYRESAAIVRVCDDWNRGGIRNRVTGMTRFFEGDLTGIEKRRIAVRCRGFVLSM